MSEKNKKISKEPYKGVRDFYPEDMAVQNYIFKKMREVTRSFGYEEYNASVLEPSELYEAKSGQEISDEQAYKFKDKANRNVIIRPEMTPTVTRMVAKKKRGLLLPIRFFSIANVFRYERPQKGRLREHWQLNADIFGVKGDDAEVEIILLAYNIMKNFGAKETDFEIKINSRNVIYLLFRHLGIRNEDTEKLLKLIDKKEKINKKEFEKLSSEITPKHKEITEWLEIKDYTTFAAWLPGEIRDSEEFRQLDALFKKLQGLSIKNTVFDPTLVRGLDYYTGIVFEVFDKNPENKRSLFGGGRYDRLFELFEEENIPAVGFGMGDVTIKDFLETYNLLPAYAPSADLYIATVSDEYKTKALEIGESLRKAGVKTITNITDKKAGDQVKLANKKNIPFVLFVGQEEVENGKFKIKNLKSAEEKDLREEEIPEIVLKK